MKVVTTGLTIVFAALSVWMWIELRDTWQMFYGHVVSTEYSRLMQARKLEEMLREGRTDDALSHIQRNRDLFVLTLRDVLSATESPIYCWRLHPSTVDKAIQTLQSEAEYRRIHGQSEGLLADQVAEALEGY